VKVPDSLAGQELVVAGRDRPDNAPTILGGAKMHAQISGHVDFREPDDDACMRGFAALLDKIGARRTPRHLAT